MTAELRRMRIVGKARGGRWWWLTVIIKLAVVHNGNRQGVRDSLAINTRQKTAIRLSQIKKGETKIKIIIFNLSSNTPQTPLSTIATAVEGRVIRRQPFAFCKRPPHAEARSPLTCRIDRLRRANK